MPMSSSDRMTALRSDQPSVGTVLRQRREELGWQIEDVAQWLRIRGRVLTALEADDFSSMPGEAYAVGFLRAYAQAMQLDADALVERFQREFRRVSGGKAELVFPQAQGERGLPIGLLIGAGFILVAAAYAGWYYFSAHDELIEKRVPSLAALMPNNAHSVMTSPQVASVMPGQAPTEEKHSAEPTPPAAQSSNVGQGNTAQTAQTTTDKEAIRPALPANTAQPSASVEQQDDDGAVASPNAGQSGGTQPETGQVAGQTNNPTNVDDKAPVRADNAQQTTDALPEGQIAVKATAQVWVQISDKNGHVLVSRVLSDGEIWQGAAADGPYKLSVGNAGGVVLMTHDAVSAALGRIGAVRRNITVTADAVNQGEYGHGVAPSSTPAQSAPVPAVTAPEVQALPHPKPRPAPVTKAVPKPAVHHELTTDELNARQLTGQSPSGDATSTH
ncbi:helix-turn-helix domain-containing protein [Neokomagataea tanensis]|nr:MULTISPECIES: RodZ domain-containing protein [Neokomagataea]